MNWYPALQVSLTLAILILIGFAISVFIQLYRTLGNVNNLVQNLNKELMPILSKLQLTVDELNSELTRVDEIVASFNEVGEKVQVVREIFSNPVAKAAGILAGVRTTLSSLMSRRK